MPDSKLPTQSSSSFDDFGPNPDDYKILRKGSVYNIQGPYGREFSRYKSASAVGPRWEELTHTPWPFESSAYQSGLRLWELGIIRREHVGLRKLLVDPVPDDKEATPDDADETVTEDVPPETTTKATASDAKTDTSPPNPYRSDVDTPLELGSPQTDDPPPPRRESKHDSKPRQQRLMFQENWDDHRPDVKPKKPTDAPKADPDSSQSQQSASD